MTLRVLSLNLWHTAGPWSERAPLIRQWVERLEPDLIGFQEAVRMPGFDQVPELLEGSGYHLDHVAISSVSRWPIVDREELELPHSHDGEKRAALSVTVDSPHGALGFTVTHLNWKLDHGWIREQQAEAVCDFALRRRPGKDFPAILVGDFNAESDSAEIRYVTGRQSRAGRSVCFVDAWARKGAGSNGITWSNRNPYARVECEPDRRIDYVFVGLPRQKDGRGEVLECRVVCDEPGAAGWPTDHFGVFAELRSEPIDVEGPSE
jgi:endonuclease/exonuclease/phosphatase family metal-dependent hydrolase